MDLFEALGLKKSGLISIVGAGGKTSLMRRLSCEANECGLRVLVTTTTAIYAPKDEWADRTLLCGLEGIQSSSLDGITVLGRCVDELGKLRGISFELACDIKKKGLFDVMLVEADGARGLAVKAPAVHEPAVPPCSNAVIGVVGMDCVGVRISENTVHRMDQFCSVTGKIPGDTIEWNDIAQLALSNDGLFKSCCGASRHLLLNKVEGKCRKEHAISIIGRLKGKGCVEAAAAVSLAKGRVVFSWNEKQGQKGQG